MPRSPPLAGPTYPSASALHGAAICVAPWSLGLPREQEENEHNAWGKLCHTGAEALAKGGTGGAVTAAQLAEGVPFELASRVRNVMTHVREALHADEDAARGAPLVEQGVRWRPGDLGDEAELIVREPGEEVPGWFPGTADLVYLRQDGVLIVADWKFGPRQPYTAERARDHWQGWSLALYIAAALGVSAARDSDVVARFEARYVDEDGAWVDGVDITQASLDQHAVTLTKMARRIEEGEGPRIGAACGGCKAKGACPAYAAIGQQAAATLVPSSTSDLWKPPQTEDEARMLHFRIGAVETWLERAKEHRRAYVLTHDPVPLGLGQELAAVGRARSAVVKTPEALALVEEVAGPDAVVEEVVRKATLTSIREAVRGSVGEDIRSASDRKKAKDAREAAVLNELAARGAVVKQGTMYAIGVRRSSGDMEIVDRLPQGGEED